VLVLVTDGQVGNEDQLVGLLAPRLGEVRVFTVGIDVAVNEAFLKRLAGLGGGACELVESEDRLDAVMERIHRRVGTPVLTDLVVEDAGLAIDPDSLSPSVNKGKANRLPDLFAGAPLVVGGRWRGRGDGAVVVRGRLASGREWRVEVPASPGANPALAAVWARGRLRDMEDAYAAGRMADQQLEQRIVATSLRFGVLCRFTAFVAVDSVVVNEGGRLRKVTQPVDAPQGWDMFGPTPVAAGAGVAGAVMAAPAAEQYQAMSGVAPRGIRPLLAKRTQMPPTPRSPEPVVVPLDAYRRRARELYGRFAGTGEGERAGRLAELRQQLAELLDDLRSVGAPEQELRPLDELLRDLSRLGADEAAGAEALARLWERALAALDAFAGATGAATVPGPGRDRPAEFWKRPPS
jgi:Ca-activated chloride channel family protein